MSNLDALNEAAGTHFTSYSIFAHVLNTTVEDCMCAINDWRDVLIARARSDAWLLQKYDRGEY